MRLRTVLAFGAGYVLGARAGRERYEQIRRWYARMADSPLTQSAQDRGRQMMDSGLGAARQAAADGLTAASDQLRRLAD